MDRENEAEESEPPVCSRCGDEAARLDRETGEYVCPACQSVVDLPLMATSLKAPKLEKERPHSQGHATGSLSHRADGRYEVLTFPEAKFAYVRFEGTLDWPVLKAATRYVFEETECDRSWRLVWDLTQIMGLVLEPGELNKLTEHVEAYVREGRRPQEALVITAEETADVIMRLYQHLASVSGYSVRLASTPAEAFEYLRPEGVPREVRQQLEGRR